MTGGAGVAAAIDEFLEDAEYDHVVATRDWHVDPGDHFADEPDYAHSWPAHCRAGTAGAQFHDNLETHRFEAVFDKGQHAAAYSGFEGHDASGRSLGDWLRDHDAQVVDVVGIATDYCVRATALDAARLGLDTTVLLDLTAGVAAATTEVAVEEMLSAGVTLRGRPVVGR